MLRRTFAHEGEGVLERAAPASKVVSVELHLAGLDLGQVEHVVEQGEQVPPGVADVPEVVLLALVEVAEHPLEQDLREADHRVERSAQLVRHAREELRLVLAGDGQLQTLAGQLLVEPGVGQGDGGLAGEGREQVAYLVVEDARLPAPHDERPDHPVGAAQRHGDQRAPAVGVEDLEVRVAVDRRRGPRSGTTTSRRRTGRPRSRRRGSARAGAGRGRRRSSRMPRAPGTAGSSGRTPSVSRRRSPDSSTAWLTMVERTCSTSRDEPTTLPTAESASSWSTLRDSCRRSGCGRSNRAGRPAVRRTSPAPRRSARRTAPPRCATPREHRRRRRR